MGQLIKLQDYTSRYEQNINHYPTQFVKLKKQQWAKLLNQWEKSPYETYFPDLKTEVDTKQGKMETSLIGKIKNLFHRNNNVVEIEELFSSSSNVQMEEELFSTEGTPPFFYRPESIEELKQQFLNGLFDFQMKWATSTIVDTSFVNKKYYYDERLKYFLQRFPDTFLVMFQPIFQLKKASIETETILISPTDVWCIKFVEEIDVSVFLGSHEKFWTVKNKREEKRIVNPSIALNRTGKIVKRLFQLYEIDLPVHKILLSRNGYIDYPSLPYDIQIVDKKGYDNWFQTLRTVRSPLKAVQLKGADALLQNCQTTSIRRMEWDKTDG